MPHLVPYHGHDLRRRLLFDCRVPHHDALRSAEPVTYAFISGVLSLAFIQNIRSGGMPRPASRDHSLDLADQRGIFALQWRKL